MRSEYQDPILMDHLEEGQNPGAKPSAFRRKQPSYYFKVFALTFFVVGAILTAYFLFPLKHNVNSVASVESSDPLLSQHQMCDTCILNPDIDDYVLCHTCPFKVDETKKLKCPSGMPDVKIIRTSVGGKMGDASLTATLYQHCQETMTDAVDFQCEFNLAELAGLQPEEDAPVEEEFFAEDEFMMDPEKFMEEFMPGEPPLPKVLLASTQAAYAEFFKQCPEPADGGKALRHPKCWDADGNPTKPTVCDDGTPIERPHHGRPCPTDSFPVCEDADGNQVLPTCDPDGTRPVEVPPCDDGSTPTCGGDPVVCLNKQTKESTPWVMGERCEVGSHPKCETKGVKATCDDGSYAKLHRPHRHRGHGKGKGKGPGGKGTDAPAETESEPLLMDAQEFMQEFMPGEPMLPQVLLSSTQAAYAEFFKQCPEPADGGKALRHPKCWDAEGNPTKPTVCDDGTPIERPHHGRPCPEDSHPVCEDAEGNPVLPTCDVDGTLPVEVPPCEDGSTPACDGEPVVCLNKQTKESTPWVMGERCEVGSHPKCETKGVKATCDDGSYAQMHRPHRHGHGKGKGKGKGAGKGQGTEEEPTPRFLSKAHATFAAYFKTCPSKNGEKEHPPSCWNGDQPQRPTICSDGSALAVGFPPCPDGVFPACGTADAPTEMTCDPKGAEQPKEISACADRMPPKCDDKMPPVCQEEGDEAEPLEEGDPHMCDNGQPPVCEDGSYPVCSDGSAPRHPQGKGAGKGKGQGMGWNGGMAPPPMNQQPVGQDGHGIAPWATNQQPVGQDGHGMAPWASSNQQPVGQDGHGIAPWAHQQPAGQGFGVAPPAMNGMPPSDMNGVPMKGTDQQMVGTNGAGRPPAFNQPGKGQQTPGQKGQQGPGQKGQGYAQQQQGDSSWGSWFQDAISPASEHVLSSTQQRPGPPGPGFGRHPWDEQEPWAENGWEQKKGGRFHHWDHWKQTHTGEVKVEFMCLK